MKKVVKDYGTLYSIDARLPCLRLRFFVGYISPEEVLFVVILLDYPEVK